MYPLEAVHDGLTGTTVVHIDVDAAGRVLPAKVYRSSGHASLEAASVEAAKHWTDGAATQHCRPQPGLVGAPVACATGCTDAQRSRSSASRRSSASGASSR